MIALDRITVLDFLILRFSIHGQMIDIITEQLAAQQQPHLDRMVRVVVAEGAAAPDDVQPLEIAQKRLDGGDLSGDAPVDAFARAYASGHGKKIGSILQSTTIRLLGAGFG